MPSFRGTMARRCHMGPPLRRGINSPPPPKGDGICSSPPLALHGDRDFSVPDPPPVVSQIHKCESSATVFPHTRRLLYTVIGTRRQEPSRAAEETAGRSPAEVGSSNPPALRHALRHFFSPSLSRLNQCAAPAYSAVLCVPRATCVLTPNVPPQEYSVV